MAAALFAAVFGKDGDFEIGEGVVALQGSAAHHRPQKYRVFKRGYQTLGELFSKGKQYPDKECIVFDHERLLYRDVYRQAGTMAQFFLKHVGVRKGDRIAIAMRNLPEWIIAFMAATSIGAIATPVNAWWNAQELDYCLNDSSPVVLLVDAPRWKSFQQCRVPGVKSVVIVRPDGATVRNHTHHNQLEILFYNDIIGNSSYSGELPDFTSPDQETSLMYTSGSTGFPKGVVLTHRNITTSLNVMAALALITERVYGEDQSPYPCVLCPVPLFHVTGLVAIFLPIFFNCNKIVLMKRWNAEDALGLIQRERVTRVTGVPTMMWEITHAPTRSQYDLTSLRSFGAGGAPVPATHVQRLKAEVPSAAPTQGYGLTETAAITCFNSSSDYETRPTSCGRPVPVVDVKVVDGHGKKVSHGVRGELLVRGPSVMKEYWRRPEDTAKAIDADGWFRTGDIATIDAEGFVFIVDRVKDIIIRGGENISCAEVEAVLYAHPAVRHASVVGLPHQRLGECVAAVVTLHAAQAVSTAELIAFAGERLARYKVPEVVQVWDELPIVATGKIDKKEIRRKLKEATDRPKL